MMAFGWWLRPLGVVALLLWGLAAPARAEVVSVAFQGSGLLGSSDSTQTFLWEAKEAKAVLIMIPGGEGHLGLTPEKADLGGFYGHALRPLSDAALTSGHAHVVIFDSPYALPAGDVYPTSRTTPDHLDRIESVVRFYKAKFALPIWLLGHSNGAISVTQFLRTRADLIDGAIFSSARVGLKVPESLTMPVLFLHHRTDGCKKADAGSSVDAFEALQAAGKKNTEFVWIAGGSAEASHPCHSGYHMYHGAYGEVYSAIDTFMAKY
jgi:pimeloyl-ACP methyl ester carboxylesterase